MQGVVSDRWFEGMVLLLGFHCSVLTVMLPTSVRSFKFSVKTFVFSRTFFVFSIFAMRYVCMYVGVCVCVCGE